MIRTLAAAFALTLTMTAGAAGAQTWGQPVYTDAWGRPVGGTPLSEVETRSWVNTGRWAVGYSDHPYVHVPGRAHGYGYGERRWRGGYGHGYGRSGYEPRPRAGYRDVQGYNDDRAPTGRYGYRDRGHDRDCDCADVYFYDR